MPALMLSLALLMLATPSELHAQVRETWQEKIMASTASPPATVAALALSIKSRAIQDSRCYLMNGGAVESFFISEDSPVGSVIGTLSINGDPSEEAGDITLRIQEQNPAVGIAPGTKNLTLLRALDREEKRGPSNVYVNVRCDRRLTTDPSFIIPVSVRVWDVNDNAPVWVGAPYRVRLSELTAAGTRVLQTARATDADQPGPHATIRYSVLPGPHSEYFAFVNELDSILTVKKPLDYETLSNFSITIRAEDHGSPPLHNDTQLFVEVLDADDQNPKFSYEHYSVVLPENAQKGLLLSPSPGPITAADQDIGINAPLYFTTTGDNKELVQIDKDTGQVAATDRLLRIQQPVTVVIKAVQVDNADRYALATLTISPPSIPSSQAVQFTRQQYTAVVSEGAAVGTVLVTLYTDPPHAKDRPTLQFYVSDRSFLEKFAINSAGEVLLRRTLDYEAQEIYHYQVMVTDGVANDTASINITVQNVNEWEPRFRYPQYEFRVEGADDAGDPRSSGPGAEGLLPVGKLDVFDGDKSDTVTLTLRGSDASMFYINNNGDMFLRQEALPMLNTSALHVVATAVDSGSPPRQTSVPVTVHVESRLRPSVTSALVAWCGGGAALAALLCLVLVYIVRGRKRSKPAPSPSKPYLTHEKQRSTSPAPPQLTGNLTPGGNLTPADNLTPRGNLTPAGGNSGSLQSVSAGASTILANSSSSLDLRDSLPNSGVNGTRQSTRTRNKAPIAPAPPPVSLMSDHLRGGAAGGRSGVAWPAATIPARVKKLSWDDAAEHKDSAEAVDATNHSVQEHMNLTVYF